jgi:hypothetical protein
MAHGTCSNLVTHQTNFKPEDILGITYKACKGIVSQSTEWINTGKTLLTYGAEPFLRSCQLCSPSRTLQHFIEPEGSIPCSQEPSTGPYPEPYQSNPLHPILSLWQDLHTQNYLAIHLSQNPFTFQFKRKRREYAFQNEGNHEWGCPTCRLIVPLCLEYGSFACQYNNIQQLKL